MQVMQQSIREDLINEIKSLPQSQLFNVLEYVRFLKIKTLSGRQIEKRFDSALKKAREIAQKEGITEEDIQNEIIQARLGK